MPQAEFHPDGQGNNYGPRNFLGEIALNLTYMGLAYGVFEGADYLVPGAVPDYLKVPLAVAIGAAARLGSRAQ